MGEQDAEQYQAALEAALIRSEQIYIPASVIVEVGAVLDPRGQGEAFDWLLENARPVAIAIDERIANIARAAYRRFGRRIHKAKLNFGDCMSYAVCIQLGDRLLFKGDDFVHTDVESVL